MRHLINAAPSPRCFPGTELSHRDGRRKLRRISSGLGLLLFLCGMATIATPLLFARILTWSGYQRSALYAATGYMDPSLYYLLAGSSFILCFLIPGLLYLAVTRTPMGQVLPSDKVRPDRWIALLFLGFGLALLSNLPANWFTDLFGNFLPSGNPKPTAYVPAVHEIATVPSMILSFVRTAVLPAFFEEFFFRGIFLGRLRPYGDGFAVCTSALLFGLFHGNLHQIPFAFLVGLAIGYIVVRTNNIWLGVAIHFCNNAFSAVQDLLRPYLSSADYDFFYRLTFYGILVMGALAAMYLLWRWREFFLPRVRWFSSPLPLSSRVFAWISAPGILLAIAYCAAETLFDTLL